jgi:hypothetical protein
MGTGTDVEKMPQPPRNPLRWFVFAVVIAANITDLAYSDTA